MNGVLLRLIDFFVLLGEDELVISLGLLYWFGRSGKDRGMHGTVCVSYMASL